MKRYAGLIDPSGPTQSEWYQMEKIGKHLHQRGYELKSACQSVNPFLEGSRTPYESKPYLPAKEWALEMASSVCLEQPLEKMVSAEIEKVLSYVHVVIDEEGSKVDFLVYWADHEDRHPLRYALRVAKAQGVSAYNLRDPEQKRSFASMLSNLD